MTDIFSRIAKLGLPVEEYIVIGSGLLDALELRTSSDVDLAVSPALFERLKSEGLYQVRSKNHESFLAYEDIEIWLGWNGDLPYEELQKTAVTVNGVRFVHPDILIQRKQERGLEKDFSDIKLLKEYRETHEL